IPCESYMYWTNGDDPDVGPSLRMFTLLPMDEVLGLEKLTGADIRTAKERLAFETTALTHGREEAEKARGAARSLFGGTSGGDDGAVPTHGVPRAALDK